MSVITIAREFGSGGKEVATLVADHLGYDCVDKELIVEVAHAAGVPEETVEKYDEISESPVRRFLKELFTPSSIYSLSPEYPPLVWPYIPGTELPTDTADLIQGNILDRKEYLKILQETILRLWKRGNVVIVGRGSQCILSNKPNTLHVRLVAPIEHRCRRVMERMGLSRDEALHLMHEKDKQRALYVQHHYHTEWQDPLLYQLICNTGLLSTQQVADLIVNAVQMMEQDETMIQ